MRPRRRQRLLGLATALLAGMLGGATPDTARAAAFQGVGDLAGGSFSSAARGVSADGRIVVGSSVSDLGTESFRWEDGVLTPLGDVPGGSFLSFANDVSPAGDGIVVGRGSGLTPAALRWQDGWLEVLEDYPTSTRGSRAEGISNDGGVVVGTAIAPGGIGFQAVRWINGQIGALAGGSMALAVSQDGRSIAGFGGVPPGVIVPILWTDEEPEYLGRLYPQSVLTEPRGISANGEVVVGFALLGNSGADGMEAFRWEAGSYEPLGDLPGGLETGSEAVDASFDGSIVVGSGTTDCGGSDCTRAVFWNQELELFDLQEHLGTLGVDTTGWTLVSAEGVSDDGLTIVGQGIDPDGFTQGWVAFLPEPDAAALELAALLPLALLRRFGRDSSVGPQTGRSPRR